MKVKHFPRPISWLGMFLSLIAALPSGAQQTRMLTPDRYSEFGLVYALPRTSFEVEIEARHTLEQAGPYCLYARKYIGTDKVITVDSERWEVIGVRVRSFGVAGDSSIYRMQLKPGALMEICVDADAMLLSINRQVEAPAGWGELQNPAPQFLPPATDYLQYVGEDFLSAQSDARRAEMLAESISEVREARLALTRGTADQMPTDGRQLELMLKSLGHQEELMMDAFQGRRLVETRKARFSLTPDGEGRYIVARVSDLNGFVEADDLSGAPVILEVTPVREGKVPEDEAGNPMKMPRDGVMYCMPGAARITISWQGSELYSQEADMSQFGTIFALDPALFTSKKAPSFAIFDPATGAVREIGQIAR